MLKKIALILLVLVFLTGLPASAGHAGGGRCEVRDPNTNECLDTAGPKPPVVAEIVEKVIQRLRRLLK